MQPIDTMTRQQATRKHGDDRENRTTSQRCPHCRELIYRDDFVGEPEPETVICPTCETTVTNKFYLSTEPKIERYTAKQVQYMKLRYHANEKLLEALKAVEKLNEQMFLGKVQAIGDDKEAALKVAAEAGALRKVFMNSGL